MLVVEDIPPRYETFATSLNVFRSLVFQGYVACIVIDIRRHIKSEDKNTSLVELFEDISKYSEYI